MRKLIFGIVFLLVGCTGCAHYRLSEAGEKVQLLEKIPAGNYARIGAVTCKVGKFQRGSCDIRLRELAAKLGADIVVIDSSDVSESKIGGTKVIYSATAYKAEESGAAE